ncbi:patatin-like phospholipase family protein [Pseudoroseomonas cervicalis]|uniref:patatin-like phospholipase family protein n=1 Tax=Teichococcus cervicalis TaxID=204525 RepID=UPI0027805D89|nr:patatin-like phospholipase family protein [Pseudoroseomonas cervicalis]MDQ1080542.1 hypothetical protein [Pseudoroseomonas cervicalis]
MNAAISGGAAPGGASEDASGHNIHVDRQKALAEEYAAIWGREAPKDWPAYLDAMYDAAPAALCLSGGGIRSAAFSIGVLQGLARRGLLAQFHYLSTVSGGGYAGGWLTRWIAEQVKRDPQAEKDPPAARLRAVQQVQAALGRPEPPRLQGAPPAPLRHPEAAPLRELRRWTNFLTPSTGLASTDTMAGLALWLRNLLLIWLILLPALLVLALLPELVARSLWAIRNYCPPHLAWFLILVASAALLVRAVRQSCVALPSYSLQGSTPAQQRPGAAGGRQESGPQQANSKTASPLTAPQLQRCIVWPCLIWAAILSALLLVPNHLDGWHTTGAALVLLLASVIGYAWAALELEAHRRHFQQNWGRWLIACCGSALALWLWLTFVKNQWLAEEATSLHRALAVSLLPLGIVGAQTVLTSLYAGLRHTDGETPGLMPDLDREWMARLSALKLFSPLAWAALSLICLALPAWLQTSAAFSWWSSAAATFGAGSGLLSGWLGRSGATGGAKRGLASSLRQRLLDGLTVAASYLFLALLLLGLSQLGLWLFRASRNFSRNISGIIFEKFALFGNHSDRFEFPVMASMILLIILFMAWAAGQIRINRFSMHATYRNRLVRAFLGSARADRDAPKRQPEPFTEFDGADSPPLHSLWPTHAGAGAPLASAGRQPCFQPLFPVINTALNVTGDNEIAWQERKALSFTITPLRCGWSNPLEGGPGKPVHSGEGSYARSDGYAGQERDAAWNGAHSSPGITLGTAMTLSGAAVSPNMGYHSSPATAMVLTLLNIRLGAWLPNPALLQNEGQTTQEHTREFGRYKTRIRQSSPRWALLPLWQELTGHSSSQADFVYLSDGGHFDNLGLYEMVRRRCRFILVSDASADPECGYADLGMAVRKIAIDQGVRIILPPLPMQARHQVSQDRPLPFVLGTIHYPDMPLREDGTPDGWLLYIKPQWWRDMPADIRAYAAQNQLFPHESTGDQWFAESQFEAYRHLGEATLDALLPARTGGWHMAQFFMELKARAG